MLFFVLCANVLIEEKKAGICFIHISCFKLILCYIMEDIQKTQNDESSTEDWSKSNLLISTYGDNQNYISIFKQ